ncbi:MAG: hypothetical protein LBS11_10335 [Oscillospiraceae bacterium]|jgi:hypothetical protein|nr:hypothetical protein [Oscillospiraceae bacterium]
MLDLMIPFNAVNGDRVYDAEDVAAMLASVVTDGAHPSPGTSLMVKSLGGWEIGVLPGRCAVRGHVGVNASEKVLSVDPPDGTLPRIDAVAIRCDFDARAISERLDKGTPSSRPSAPEPRRDASAWDLTLARILVEPTASGVTQADITDTRWDASACGVMHSLIEVGAEGLFAQFQAAWDAWLEAVQQDAEDWAQDARDQFEDWLATVRDLLDGSAAAQLASAVATLRTDVGALSASSAGMVYEKGRETGSIEPSAWAMDETLGLWRADAEHAAVTGEGSDVAVIIDADCLREAVLGSGAAGEGTVTLYASRKPERAVGYTVIVTGVRDY